MSQNFELEHKFQTGSGPLILAEDNLIEGYASHFGLCDQGGDRVLRGAYAASLQRAAAEQRQIRMLWQHDPHEPIGVWEDVREDATGLWVRGCILPQIRRGAEALALIAAGALDGLSIGYRTVRATKGAEGGRELHEVDLWEVSLVTFPMLPSARVSKKKAPDPLAEVAADLRALWL